MAIMRSRMGRRMGGTVRRVVVVKVKVFLLVKGRIARGRVDGGGGVGVGGVGGGGDGFEERRYFGAFGGEATTTAGRWTSEWVAERRSERGSRSSRSRSRNGGSGGSGSGGGGGGGFASSVCGKRSVDLDNVVGESDFFTRSHNDTLGEKVRLECLLRLIFENHLSTQHQTHYKSVHEEGGREGGKVRPFWAGGEKGVEMEGKGEGGVGGGEGRGGGRFVCE